MTTYSERSPQRTVTIAHHTIATWLPVTLSCGHVEKINWTARVGSKVGCIACDKLRNASRENGALEIHAEAVA